MPYGLEENVSFALPTGVLSQLLVYLIAGLAVLAVALVILFISRKILSGNKFLPASLRKKVFLLTVPQRPLASETAKTDIEEKLAGVENFYANLGGLPAARGWQTWLFGRQDDWSFEIVVQTDGQIMFYAAVPAYLADYFQQQFLSQSPDLQIEEVADYNIFGPRGAAAAGQLQLAKAGMFPILTYRQMEVDPLVGILGSLAKLPAGQAAAIQFIMRSAKREWRRPGIRVAAAMQQGKSLRQALASGSGGGWLGALGKPAEWFYGGTPKEAAPLSPLTYRLSPLEEQTMRAIGDKAAKAGLDVNVRLIAFAPTADQAKGVVRQIANTFAQYSGYEYANSFKAVIKGAVNKIINDFIYRVFDERRGFVLNTEELASLWHLPLPGTAVPKLKWLQARQLPPPVNLPTEGIILGENVYRGQTMSVRLKDGDRRRHLYVIGMTGTGKSWFQANLAIQDIKNGHGVCVIDPHGSLIEDILPRIPPERLDEVILFDPADVDQPIGLNMLEAATPQEMDFAVQELITIFYKLLPDPAMAGPMFEHYMRNALLALMADQNRPGTLVELGRLFMDNDFRAEKLKAVTDQLVKDFWEREYPASQRGASGADMLSYVISKTGRFVENALMRNIIGQAKSGINFRQVMDEGKILLINLSKGRVGEINSNLLGLIAVSKLQMAALARADLPEEQRRDFYLYIDEFQNFITESISVILAEARKYRLNLIMAHQYIAQLAPGGNSRVKDAVFGNVGNIVCFRIGVDDAEFMAKQLAPEVGEYDLLNLEKFQAYVRLLVDNTATPTFNLRSLSLPTGGNPELAAKLKEMSRQKYGRPRTLVEKDIFERASTHNV